LSAIRPATAQVDDFADATPASLPKPKRIDVGNDDEIADILDQAASGDVTI
jgi:hypothetical protein